MSTSTTTQKIAEDILVDLALQGGGAHGAFTWGVLDRLLQEPRLGIDGISGTSAGAMNAAVLADRRRALGPFQSVSARPPRPAARPLDARPIADVHHDGSDVETV